jgi:S-formylglutathione hydrolase
MPNALQLLQRTHIAGRAQKGGFMCDAAAQGIALLFPDTSPRGAGIEGEEVDWDFGTGR